MIIEDMDLNPLFPLPIPTITVYGPDGRECATGYYDYHQNTSRCFAEDMKPTDFDHVVVTDSFSDWNLPQGFVMKKIVPDGGKVEINYPKCENEASDCFKCSECGDVWFSGCQFGPPAFRFCPSCGREVSK